MSQVVIVVKGNFLHDTGQFAPLNDGGAIPRVVRENSIKEQAPNKAHLRSFYAQWWVIGSTPAELIENLLSIFRSVTAAEKIRVSKRGGAVFFHSTQRINRITAAGNVAIAQALKKAGLVDAPKALDPLLDSINSLFEVG